MEGKKISVPVFGTPVAGVEIRMTFEEAKLLRVFLRRSFADSIHDSARISAADLYRCIGEIAGT